ncbi:MAG: hypothetical protein WDW38_002408 [Sanguina aurantia]
MIRLAPSSDTLPQELYHFESGSAWEAEALATLVKAPVAEEEVAPAPPCAAVAAVQAAAAAAEERAAAAEARAEKKAERQAEKRALAQQQLQQQQQGAADQGMHSLYTQWHTNYPGYYWDGYAYVTYPDNSSATASGHANYQHQQQASPGHNQAQASQDQGYAAEWDAYYAQQQQQQQQQSQLSNGHSSPQDFSAEWAAYYSQQAQSGSSAGLDNSTSQQQQQQQQHAQPGSGAARQGPKHTHAACAPDADDDGVRGEWSGDDGEVGLDVLVGRPVARPQRGTSMVRFDLSHSSDGDDPEGSENHYFEGDDRLYDGSDGDYGDEGSAGDSEGGERVEGEGGSGGSGEDEEGEEGGELDAHAASLIDTMMLLSVAAPGLLGHQSSAGGPAASSHATPPPPTDAEQRLGGVNTGAASGVVAAAAAARVPWVGSAMAAAAVSHRAVTGVVAEKRDSSTRRRCSSGWEPPGPHHARCHRPHLPIHWTRTAQRCIPP